MNNIKNKQILKYILFFSVIALCFAYFVEYVLGYKPCNLCLIERVPYMGSIFFISLIFLTKKFEKSFVFIILLLFIFGAIISFYHLGIEKGFFNESLVCELSKIGNNMSTNELLEELENKTISCKDVDFRVLGFSLATINTLISALISVIIIKILINYEKNK